MAENVLKLSPRVENELQREQAALTTTEDALALRFIERFGDHYRSVPGLGWLRFEDTHWARDLRLRHFDDARAVCRDSGVDDRSNSESRRIASAKTVAAVIQLARADQRIVELPQAFDADPLLLNTPTGVVNLRDASIRPHGREYLTKRTNVAPAFGETPTVWLQFLADVFENDEDVIAFVRRLLGYALTGETREQVIAFFHGDGANGKSTLLDLVLWLMGDYAIKIPSAMLMLQRGTPHPTDVATLRGTRLAVANEVAEGEHWDEGRVKELTGDMKLTARFMRQDFFQFDATHKFLIAANHRPQVRTMDHAMRRRLLLIPFHARFDGERRDPDMLAKLQAEAGAILAWLIIGAADWHESGLAVPRQVREASDQYADAMDSLGNWLADCCRQTGDPLDSEKAGTLYRSYADWKRGRGEQPVSLTRWGEQMRGRGFESYRNDGMRYRTLELNGQERQRIADAAHLREGT